MLSYNWFYWYDFNDLKISVDSNWNILFPKTWLNPAFFLHVNRLVALNSVRPPDNLDDIDFIY